MSWRVCLLTTVVVLLFPGLVWAKTEGLNVEAAKHLPDQVGSFKAIGTAVPQVPDQIPRLFGEGSVVRTYTAGDAGRYRVQLQVTANDAAAFALLTHARLYLSQILGSDGKLTFDEVGTASFTKGGQTFFYKGSVFASVMPTDGSSDERARELARKIAEPLSSGEGEIPVLVKHL